MPDFGSGVSVVGSIAGGLIGGDAAEEASNAQVRGNQQSINEQKRQFNTTREDFAPFLEAGTGAVNFLKQLLLPGGNEVISPDAQTEIDSLEAELNNIIANNPSIARKIKIDDILSPLDDDQVIGHVVRGINTKAPRQSSTTNFWNFKPRNRNETGAVGNRIQTLLDQIDNLKRTAPRVKTEQDTGKLLEQFSPGFKFRQSEGEKALDRSQAARSNVLSGRAVKEALRFNQDFASNEFGNFIQRLFALSDTGRGAASTTGQIGASTSNNISNILANSGAATAQGILNKSQAITGGISSGINNFLALQQQQKLLEALG